MLAALQDFFAPADVPPRTQTILTRTVLGLLACSAAGFVLASQSTSLAPLWLFVGLLSLFHLGEYTWAWAFEPRGSLSFNSTLLTQNWPDYQIALGASFVEYAVEAFFFPRVKRVLAPMSMVGLCLCIMGLVVRAIGMWTTRSNFTHKVAEHKRADHALVTSGIYSVLRHPAYFGWYWWTVGSQMLLGNPLCAVGFAVVSSLFFRQRIPFEESKLVDFFGNAYREFMGRTIVGIPGVPGAADGDSAVVVLQRFVSGLFGKKPQLPARRPHLLRAVSAKEHNM